MATAQAKGPPPGNYELPEDMKMPITVITGFLGAGKTTLLNHILTAQHGMKFAVVENEYGEVGIDSDLVNKSAREYQAEEIVSMDNGCLCCTVRDDLVRGIRNLLSKKELTFDAIIIETTGMADPAPVVQTFYQNEDLRRRCRVDGVITVVDCKHVKEHLYVKPELGEGQVEVVNECMQQVAFADRILLNKTDLVKEEDVIQLKHDMKTINRLADHIECQHSKVDPKLLINISRFSLEKAIDFDPDFLKEEGHEDCDHENGVCGHEGEEASHDHAHGHGHEHGHDHDNCDKKDCKDDSHDHGHGHGHEPEHGHGHSHEQEEHSHGHDHKKKFKPKTRHDMAVKSVGIKLDKNVHMNLSKLQHWIGELVAKKGEDMFRYKGILSVKGFEEKFVFQGVHMLFDGNFMGNWDVPEEERQCKFVFIGKNLDREELNTGFSDCIAADLRFKIGHKVMARVKGGFKEGTVIKQWDAGNPYRIKLDDTGVEVFGPMDDDRVVRAVGA